MLPKQQQQRQHTRTHAPTEIVSLEVDPARERLHAGGSRRGRATLPAGRRAGPTGRGHSNGAPRLWLRGGGGAHRVRRRRSKPRSRPKKGRRAAAGRVGFAPSVCWGFGGFPSVLLIAPGVAPERLRGSEQRDPAPGLGCWACLKFGVAPPVLSCDWVMGCFWRFGAAFGGVARGVGDFTERPRLRLGRPCLHDLLLPESFPLRLWGVGGSPDHGRAASRAGVASRQNRAGRVGRHLSGGPCGLGHGRRSRGHPPPRQLGTPHSCEAHET
mmetsp:Transcript_65957/g.148865  ORF Transcript_65957/g.148865 Transcript_65957/m.148865 type:complete len:270 (+) Transcript_65957:90-899(+)